MWLCWIRESNMLDFPYQHGDEMPRMPAGQGLTGRIMETGAPLLINRDIAKRRQELGTQLVGKQATLLPGRADHGGRRGHRRHQCAVHADRERLFGGRLCAC